MKRSKMTFLLDKPTKPLVFLFSALCFNVAPSIFDNGLPTVTMRFGVSDDKVMSCNVHIDSCAGLNIGNLNIYT